MVWRKIVSRTGIGLGKALSLRSNIRAKRADADRKILVTARKGKGAPKRDSSGRPTDAYKYQVAAEGVRQRRMGRRGY